MNGDLVRGLIRREPDLDIIRIQDVGLLGTQDPLVLEWVAAEGRILVTHDRATIPDFAHDRILAGLQMPGVYVVGGRLPVRQAIEDILLIVKSTKSVK